MSELTVEAKTEAVLEVTEFIDEELEALDCPMKVQFQIDVAVDELFSNVARYAYGDGTGPVTVRVEALDDESGVAISFIDQGIPFNPLEIEDPDTTLSAEEREIGGLGIFVVKKTMDDVTYEYRDGSNIVTVIKHF